MSSNRATSEAARLKERATAHGRAGKLQLAVREFTDALERWSAEDGDDLRSVCLQNRGLCYQQMEQLEAAARDFSAAVEIAPTSAAPYVNRGGVLYLLGQTSGALADFKRYLELDPDDRLGMHETVRAHITMGCAPPDDIAGGGETSEDETLATAEQASLLHSPDHDTDSPSLRRGRHIPQYTTGPIDDWLNGANIPKPQRWEWRRTHGPQAPSAGTSSDLARVSSEVSDRWYKQAAACGALAMTVIVAILTFSLV